MRERLTGHGCGTHGPTGVAEGTEKKAGKGEKGGVETGEVINSWTPGRRYSSSSSCIFEVALLFFQVAPQVGGLGRAAHKRRFSRVVWHRGGAASPSTRRVFWSFVGMAFAGVDSLTRKWKACQLKLAAGAGDRREPPASLPLPRRPDSEGERKARLAV